jgi:hypothetical protein
MEHCITYISSTLYHTLLPLECVHDLMCIVYLSGGRKAGRQVDRPMPEQTKARPILRLQLYNIAGSSVVYRALPIRRPAKPQRTRHHIMCTWTLYVMDRGVKCVAERERQRWSVWCCDVIVAAMHM